MEGLNRFAGILARSKDSLGRTLDTLPDAVKVLNDNRTNIVDAFTALGRLGTVAADVLARTKVDFAADFKDLYPVVKAFDDNADDFVSALPLATDVPVRGQEHQAGGARRLPQRLRHLRPDVAPPR